MKFLFIAFIFLLQLSLESDWEIKKEKSGIIIYTRAVEGSSFDEFKGTSTIANSSLNDVLSIILDVVNYDKLYPDCKNPEILKQDGLYHEIHYIVLAAPWPVQNRDAIYEMTTVISDNGKHALVSMKPRPDYHKSKEDLYRIQKGSGFWELVDNSDGTITVTYQFHGEPGGNIPAWLANSFVVTHPLKTIENLKNLVKK